MWFQLLQVDVMDQHVFLRAMKSQRNNTGCDLTRGLNINPGRVPTVTIARTRLHPRQTQHVWTMWHFQPGALRTSLATQHTFLTANLQFKKKKKKCAAETSALQSIAGGDGGWGGEAGRPVHRHPQLMDVPPPRSPPTPRYTNLWLPAARTTPG